MCSLWIVVCAIRQIVRETSATSAALYSMAKIPQAGAGLEQIGEFSHGWLENSCGGAKKFVGIIWRKILLLLNKAVVSSEDRSFDDDACSFAIISKVL